MFYQLLQQSFCSVHFFVECKSTITSRST